MNGVTGKLAKKVNISGKEHVITQSPCTEEKTAKENLQKKNRVKTLVRIMKFRVINAFLVIGCIWNPYSVEKDFLNIILN